MLRKKQEIFLKTYAFFEGRERVLDAFEGKIFPIKLKVQVFQTRSQTIYLKILTPKQMFQRLPVALAQEKAGNTSENLLNKNRQIIYSLCQEKEITI